MPQIRRTSFRSIDTAPSDTSRQPELTIADWQLGSVEPPGLGPVIFGDIDRPSGVGELEHLEQQLEQAAAVKAEETLTAARKKGFAQGYSEGLEEGKAEGAARGLAAAQEEVDELRESLRASVESLARAREELLASMELDLSEIVLNLAAELAAGALEVEPERIVELARSGMRLLAESDTVNLRAASGPAALLREAAESLEAGTGGAQISVSEDPGLEITGCVVESELARVDMRISQRLAAARDLLKRTRGEG